MIGQGRPLAVRLSLSIRLLITIFATLCLLPQISLLGEEKDGARLRFTWGGGSDSVWRVQEFEGRRVSRHLEIQLCLARQNRNHLPR